MSSNNQLERFCEAARKDLLDLSLRNRLINLNLNYKRSSNLRVQSDPSLVFQALVRDGKSLSFGSLGTGVSEEIQNDDVDISQDETGSNYASPAVEMALDDQLQTGLVKAQLEAKLLKLFYDARTAEEEQGVSILYLVLGVLKWFEDDKSDKPRHAPLILIPVDLERASVKAGFKLKFRDDEIGSNLSLQAKLKQDFGVSLPDIPDTDNWSPLTYFSEVKQALNGQTRWEVCPQIQMLWMFSFAKYLMYRDLAPESWPGDKQLGSNQNIQRLIDPDLPHEPPICDEDDRLDPLIHPREMFHVTEADSSQAVVIEEVRRGRSLVVQGPPGTGKSQTIANMIATAVKDGKRVLFVAEKMAALEVVKTRLQRFGLDPICLELHSHKANKKSVLAELKRTLELGRPKVGDIGQHIERLVLVRDSLNDYADALNTPIANSGLTPFEVIGKLGNLHEVTTESSDFTLAGAEEWTAGQFQSMRSVIKKFLPVLEKVHPISRHPWRGVTVTSNLLPTQRDGRLKDARHVLASLQELSQLALILAMEFGRKELPVDVSLRGIRLMAGRARHLAAVPRCDFHSLGHDVWDQQFASIKQLVRDGVKLSTAKSGLQQQLTETAWEADLVHVRKIWGQRGKSWFRWFFNDFREARTTLLSLLTIPLPKSYHDQVRLIDSIISVRNQSQKLFVTQGKLGSAAFGSQWQGEDSNWEQLQEIVSWIEAGLELKCGEFRKRLSKFPINDTMVETTNALERTLALWAKENRLAKLFDFFGIDLVAVFGIANIDQIPMTAIDEYLSCWIESPEGLSDWVSYVALRSQLRSHNLEEYADHLDSGEIGTCAAIAKFDQRYYEILWGLAQQERTPLQAFSGRSHEQAIAEFRTLDQQRIELARQEVLKSHFEGIPRSSGAGEMAVIQKEVNKKSRLLPIRKLMNEAGRVVQQIKPVFLMSPMSVAQYLPPGRVEFDLLIIDEASQVTPADAMGALVRAKQAVVVGDEQQLPPTSFFSRISGSDEEEDNEDAADATTRDLESVLGLCQSRGWPKRMLQWHYRSRHDSLIAVSNQEFYDNRLYVVPSPAGRQDSLGLQFRHLPNAAYDRGKSRTNRDEARHIAQAVLEHARRSANKSLGIGSFSMSQRDAILNEIELLRRENPDIEQFFQPNENDPNFLEPFFVKNLENIQGDERDVIFISVGYGRDASGYMTMSFGPLNGDGGHRRMNVLISRARERCVVFSSLTHNDIDTERTKARGPAVLKTFLRYAQTGILDSARPTGGECESDFEEQVKRAIENQGFTVHTQIGTAGFRVDLAVVDPRQPGHYLLGVECDGATYHSARWARERDRLREAVLVDHGWRIHRIWSTDWFQRPKEQLEMVLEAVRKAMDESDNSARSARDTTVTEQSALPIERETEDEPEDEHTSGIPYQEADFYDHGAFSLSDASGELLATIVARIVDIEGPVFHLEVVRRLATLCGHQRLSSRLATIGGDAVQLAVRQNRVRFEDGFLCAKNPKPVAVRNRSYVRSSDLKKADYLPPIELATAIHEAVSRSIGLTRTELLKNLIHVLGLGGTSQSLRRVFDQIVEQMMAGGDLAERDGRLYCRDN